MKLQVGKSQNSTTYYVAKSFRNEAGKITSKIVERLESNVQCRTNEQIPLKLLEKKQKDNFDLSKVVVCTDLKENALDIIKINSGRRIIENTFRTMKTEFEARDVFLQRRDCIEAHFLTCFLTLLL